MDHATKNKGKLPVAFYVMLGVDALLMVLPVGLLIVFKMAEESLKESCAKAVERGLLGLQAEYLQSIEGMKGNYIFGFVLLVICGLFTLVSLYFTAKKRR